MITDLSHQESLSGEFLTNPFVSNFSLSKVSVSGILTVAPFAKVLSNKKRSDCLCGPGGAALICRRHEAASLLQCPGELNMVRRTDDVEYDDLGQRS